MVTSAGQLGLSDKRASFNGYDTAKHLTERRDAASEDDFMQTLLAVILISNTRREKCMQHEKLCIYTLLRNSATDSVLTTYNPA